MEIKEQMSEPRKTLAELGLSESEVGVYLAMMGGALSAREIIKMTEQKRPTVYYALGCLEKRGLVSKTGREGERRFALAPASRLLSIVEEKDRGIRALAEEVRALVPILYREETGDVKPSVAFFEGIAAVKREIMDTLYCRNKDISSIVPKQNFFEQIGGGFIKEYVIARMGRGIGTRNLWEETTTPDVIERFYKKPSGVRLLPRVMHGRFATTIFLYDDQTLYVSSLRNSYCVRITSAEHQATMLALFDGLWASSTPHP